MKEIYIGIDPDVRLLNAAVIDENLKPLAVFVRKNNKDTGDDVIVNAAFYACRLVEDVIAYIVANADQEWSKVHTVIESQNMSHTHRARQKGLKINYDDIRKLSQVTGCLMGAFSNLSDSMELVTAVEWKGSVPKKIHHSRIYSKLGLEAGEKKLSNIYPANHKDLSSWSKDKINPGDFKDINDSLGLALYRATKY